MLRPCTLCEDRLITAPLPALCLSYHCLLSLMPFFATTIIFGAGNLVLHDHSLAVVRPVLHQTQLYIMSVIAREQRVFFILRGPGGIPRPGKPGGKPGGILGGAKPCGGKPGGPPKPGPPTPAAGPCKLIPAPRPAGLLIPGPAVIVAPAPVPASFANRAAGSAGGSSVAVTETMLFPRRMTSPSVRDSSVSSIAPSAPGACEPFAGFCLIFRDSWHSANTRFMC